jgi:hypothetical protein
MLVSARDLLIYLIRVAAKTEGAEVWRALFSEMLARYPEEK